MLNVKRVGSDKKTVSKNIDIYNDEEWMNEFGFWTLSDN